MPTNAKISHIVDQIEERSRETRAEYLQTVDEVAAKGPRDGLACGNLAHAYASMPAGDKLRLTTRAPVIGVATAYNDMLSAHAPYKDYPDVLKEAARKQGAVVQVAGGVPAMCDGVTQGQDGMELSLFSRDVIAMATAVAFSHATFDAGLCLGVCDKIVPGLFIGALSFGHLPMLFVPAGPMTSGLPNKEKARIRGLFAEGKIGRDELLKSEMASYHSPGTCTFYGTANSNQMLMEVMGLHLPGSAFVNPNTPLRDALTGATVERALSLAADGKQSGRMITAASFVNGIVGLLATGGSTNHTLHLLAMARAAGYILTWDDFAALSEVTPLLARVYPNGSADVNHFHASGGMGFVIRELLKVGGLVEEVDTVAGYGLSNMAQEPFLKNGELVWREAVDRSLNEEILRPADRPFAAQGGLKVLKGNLGTSVIKTSAVAPEHRLIEAPAVVFDDQDEFLNRFKAGELDKDFIAVVRFQGPASNGMPELHKLSPSLGVLQDRGFKVALVTDGRMSGASGKTPAAIHVTPEALRGGTIAKVRDGDLMRLDAEGGVLEVMADDLASRPAAAPTRNSHAGLGRELFGGFREKVGAADSGASALF